MDGSPPPTDPSIAPSETNSDSEVTPSGTTGTPATFVFPPSVLGKDEKLPPGFERCTFRFTVAQPQAKVGAAFDASNGDNVDAMTDSGKPHTSPSVTHQPPAEPSPPSNSNSSSSNKNKKRAYRRKKAPAPSISSAVATASDGNTPTSPIVRKSRRKFFPPMYYNLKGKVDHFPWLVNPQPCDRILIDVVTRTLKKPWIPPIGVAWSAIRNAVHVENSTVFPTVPQEKGLKGRFENLMKFTALYNHTHPRRSGMAESVKLWLDDLTALQQERQEYIDDVIASQTRIAGRKRITARQQYRMLGLRPPQTQTQAGAAATARKQNVAARGAAETARQQNVVASNGDDTTSSLSSVEVATSPNQVRNAKQQIQCTVGLLEKLDETQRQFQAWLATATPPIRAERGENSPIAASLAASPLAPTVGAAASNDGNTTTTTTTTTNNNNNNNNNNNSDLLQLMLNQQQMMLNMNRHLEEDRNRMQRETSQLRESQMQLSSDVRSLVNAMSEARHHQNHNTNTDTNHNNNNNNNDGDGKNSNSRNGNDDAGK